jgi:orotate phosphoribosyltransferase-like protein
MVAPLSMFQSVPVVVWPSKSKKISDQLVDKAIQLKSQGMSWRKIGDKLQLNFQSVRTAINRRNIQTGIGSQA